MGCPTFADDLTLLASFPSFLQHLMSIVFDFSIKWRYKFSHTKARSSYLEDLNPTCQNHDEKEI